MTAIQIPAACPFCGSEDILRMEITVLGYRGHQGICKRCEGRWKVVAEPVNEVRE